MGVDWKIFKPKRKIQIKDFINSIKSLLDVFPKASIKLSSAKWSKNEIQKLNRLQLREFYEYSGTIKTTNNREFFDLFKSEDLLEFGIFSTVNSQYDNALGFRVLKSKNQTKANLEIELPYSQKSTSIQKLTNFLNHLNKHLWLNFRNRQQIEFTVKKLIDNLFDDTFYDSEWILKHSNHTYKRSGTTKKVFENLLEETFRATGIRILFPDNIGKLSGWQKYRETMFFQILEYFDGEEFQLYFNSQNESLSNSLLDLDLTSIELLTTFNITNLIKNKNEIDFQFLLQEDKSSLTIEFEPNKDSSSKEFTFYLYRVNNEELEVRLEIDKYAKEYFINTLIKDSGIEMDFSHQE